MRKFVLKDCKDSTEEVFLSARELSKGTMIILESQPPTGKKHYRVIAYIYNGEFVVFRDGLKERDLTLRVEG